MGHQFRKERPRTNENNPVLRINLGFSANDSQIIGEQQGKTSEEDREVSYEQTNEPEDDAVMDRDN